MASYPSNNHRPDLAQRAREAQQTRDGLFDAIDQAVAAAAAELERERADAERSADWPKPPAREHG